MENEDRFTIGDYARKNGNSAALRKFKSKFPGLKESTIRSFKARVVKEIKDAPKVKQEVTQSLSKYSKSIGRPLMLGELDEMVQSYIKAVSSCGALVNSSLAKATAISAHSKIPSRSWKHRHRFVKLGKKPIQAHGLCSSDEDIFKSHYSRWCEARN